MNNILKNSWTLFTRNKEYFSSIVVTPIIMLLIFSFILSFQSKVNIAVIDLDHADSENNLGRIIKETIAEMDFLNPVTSGKDEIEKDIAAGKIELAVIIDSKASGLNIDNSKPVEIVAVQGSKLARYMERILNTEIEYNNSGSLNKYNIMENDVPDRGVPINNALGIIIFKMIGTASILAGLIIMEKKNGIQDRIYMSRTSLSFYLAGRGIVFFVHLQLFSFIYFITARVFHFDFGKEYPAQLLIVFAVLGIFTTAFGLLLAAFSNDDNSVWNIGIMVLLPASILSGALFPFAAMPETLQAIGMLFPQRWIAAAIETLQKGGSLQDTFIPLTGVLALSAILFITASIRLKSRRG